MLNAATLSAAPSTQADDGNVALGKPAHSNLSKPLAQNVTDGDIATEWSGVFFPAYVDVDLLDTYDIEKIVLYFPKGKQTYYTLYVSNDGKNYDRIHRTRDTCATHAGTHQITFHTPQRYRIVRVNIEFTGGDNKAYLSEIKVYGKKTGSNTGMLRNGSFEEILGIKPFSETEYATPVTDKETIENVYGIIDRTVGPEYRSWFTFELADKEAEHDYFELSDADGRILIKGNEGLSLATGLNYYFKNYAGVHISEQTMQATMPERIVPIGGTVRKETPYKVRYAFNYCTLNYTFSFFGEQEWQRENDWLALNGVNVVLDLAGQEATWIRFLMNFGYSFDDAKDWLTGPAYYAWQFMDNMESFGGPVPDGYVKDRVELARKTQRWKRSLGMQTVLQGYAGMVPTNFNEFQPDAKTIKQGNWNGFARPWMIATDSPDYDDYARKFYEAQEFVYGQTSDFYAVDPFHEGGIRSQGLTDEIISKEVLESLLEYDSCAVWIVQGWQSNPTNGLLNGMGEHKNNHVLIVDLIKYPLKSWTKYNKLKYDRTTLDSPEFNGTDWAWCLLANFGGNPSMHGQMDVMVDDILTARKTSKHMQGIGIISEATYDNPVMYDLIFDLVWADEKFSTADWLEGYVERRYGTLSPNARKAWEIMRKSNYDHGVRYTNELFGMKGKGPQDYGMQEIPYGAENLEKAFKLLASDFDSFKDNECYRYDMTEIMRQIVSNYAVLTYNNLLKAKEAGSLPDFRTAKEKFLRAFDILNEVQATQREQLGGEWIGKARDRAAGYDDFARDAFEMNAKTLITTWGSRGGSSLKDYGWRNYEGIFTDIYRRIWSDYLDQVEKNLADGTPVRTMNAKGYFDFYWNWITGTQNYTREAKDSPDDLKKVIDLVTAYCSLDAGIVDPNAGNIAFKRKVAINGDWEVETSCFATDGDTTIGVNVMTPYKNRKAVSEITVDLIGEFQLSKVDLSVDYGFNTADPCEIYTSTDNENWVKIGGSDDTDTTGSHIIPVDNTVARFVKAVSIGDIRKTMARLHAVTVNEFRVYGERMLPSLEQLSRLINAARHISAEAARIGILTERTSALIENAEDVLANAAPPDEVNTIYWALYDDLAAIDLNERNIAKGKKVTAHNDPSGRSGNINDGDEKTHWDSGRLSATGKPYEDTITPGYAEIDLGVICRINHIILKFAKQNIWYKYALYTSRDGNEWELVGSKETETTPGAEDHYALSKRKRVKARYVKVVTTDIQTDQNGKRQSYGISELEVYGSPIIAKKEQPKQTSLR